MKLKLTDEKLEQVIALLRAGMHAERAFVALGLGESTYRWLRMRAREGSKKYGAIVQRLEEAIAMSEAADVITTRRAATVDQADVPCESCGHVMKIDPMLLLASGRQLQLAHNIKTMAASAAFQRLQLRFPQRWSPRVTHTIEEQHSEFLECAQRVLAPEVFERLLEAYIALREGAGEAPGVEVEPPPGTVH